MTAPEFCAASEARGSIDVVADLVLSLAAVTGSARFLSASSTQCKISAR
jgi:hypothetical protein